LACGPSRGAAALVWAGLLELESRSDGRKEKPPTGGPRTTERGEGEGVVPIWAVERENGPPGWARRGKERAGEKVLGRRERKKKGEGEREMGRLG